VIAQTLIGIYIFNILLHGRVGRRFAILGLILLVGVFTSHYAIALIFITCFIFSGVMLYFGFPLNYSPRRRAYSKYSKPLLFSGLFLAICFSVWYLYTSGGIIVSEIIGVIIEGVIFIITGGTISSRTGAHQLSQASSSTILLQIFVAVHLLIYSALLTGYFLEVRRLFMNRTNCRIPARYILMSTPILGFLGVSFVYKGHFGSDRLIIVYLMIFSPYLFLCKDLISSAVSFIIPDINAKNSISYLNKINIVTVLLIVFLILNSGIIQYTSDTSPEQFPFTSDQDYPVFTQAEEKTAKWTTSYVRDKSLTGRTDKILLLYRHYPRGTVKINNLQTARDRGLREHLRLTSASSHSLSTKIYDSYNISITQYKNSSV
jgi:hypothetical protein